MDQSQGHHLSAELIDGITEAVASRVDPRERADVIADLVHEVDEAIKWRNERHPGGEEEQSLVALVTAAAVHRHRMDDVVEIVDDEDEGDTVTDQDFQQLSASAARPVNP